MSIKPTWASLLDHLPKADTEFLQDRPLVIDNEGRFDPDCWEKPHKKESEDDKNLRLDGL